jgi:DNA-binding NtrC family response regulator
LVLEQDRSELENIRVLIHGQGLTFLEALSKNNVLSLVQQKCCELCIIGSSQRDQTSEVGIAEEIRHFDKQLPIILLVRESSEATAVAALRAKVNDYFTYPLPFPQLAASIRRCVGDGPVTIASAGSDVWKGDEVVGTSKVMQELRAYLMKLAASDSNVLITGETGTGKELAAELIHKNSFRCAEPFVCVNCAAIPDTLVESEFFGFEKGAFTGAHAASEGKLKLANGGTVLLDEIGEMSPYIQAKLLRAIDKKEIQPLGARRTLPLDIRIVAATNQDVDSLVDSGKFRKDLYFRLNVGRIHLPSLRERREDIPYLLQYYITKMNRRLGTDVEGFVDSTMNELVGYDWPGNVRELKNVVEAAFVNRPSRVIGHSDLPKHLRERIRNGAALPRNERDQLLSALLATNWNKSKTAQKLQWSRMTLYRKMAKYQIICSKQPSHKEKSA